MRLPPAIALCTAGLALSVAAAASLLSGCTEVNGNFCNNANPCDPDSDRPYCDFAGDYGPSNTCIPAPPDAAPLDGPDAGAVQDATPGGPDAAAPDAADLCAMVDCDDGVDCTDDSCEDGACSSVANHTNCTDDSASFCHPTLGCVAQTCAGPGDCDDGVFCNGEETCDVPTGETVGTCHGGVAPTCDDGIACTLDGCSPVTDACSFAPDHDECDDGLFCNGAETCSATMGCRAGTPPALSDGVACTNDSCDEGADRVVHSPSDAACDDGLFCNGAETCSATMGCQAGFGPLLSDGVGCTVDSCNEATDQVVHTPTNSLCDDAQFCNGAETCHPTAGCQAGTAPALSDGIDCTVDACNEVMDRVTHTADSSVCDDGAYCNGAETCSTSAGCQAGTAPALGDGVGCTIDWCDESADTVRHTPDDGECDDGAFCNGAETCHATAGCQAGTSPVLGDGVGCTVDSCDEATDTIIHTATDSLCDDGKACTGAETCDETLGCQDGTDVTCAVNPVCETANSCTEPGGVCDPTLKNIGVTWAVAGVGSGSKTLQCGAGQVAYHNPGACTYAGVGWDYTCSISTDGKLRATVNMYGTVPSGSFPCFGPAGSAVTSGCSKVIAYPADLGGSGHEFKCCW